MSYQVFDCQPYNVTCGASTQTFTKLVTCSALAYQVQDRAKTHFPWIYGSMCKVYPFFWCNGTAKRHSSHFVGAHRKKKHARERTVIQMGKFQLNTCGIYGLL